MILMVFGIANQKHWGYRLSNFKEFKKFLI